MSATNDSVPAGQAGGLLVVGNPLGRLDGRLQVAADHRLLHGGDAGQVLVHVLGDIDAPGAAASAGFACSAGGCWPPPHPSAMDNGKNEEARASGNEYVGSYATSAGTRPFFLAWPPAVNGVRSPFGELSPTAWTPRLRAVPVDMLHARPRPQHPRRLRVPPFRGLLHGRLAHSGRRRRLRTPSGRTAFCPAPALEHAGQLPEGAAAVLTPLADGACPAFDRAGGNLCAVQRRLGHERPACGVPALPPRDAARAGCVRVTLSHFCPTAAWMLFRPDVARLDIVADAAGIADRREHEGFDARHTIPPLLRPGVATDAGDVPAPGSGISSARWTPDGLTAEDALARGRTRRGGAPRVDAGPDHARRPCRARHCRGRRADGPGRRGWHMPTARRSRLFRRRPLRCPRTRAARVRRTAPRPRTARGSSPRWARLPRPSALPGCAAFGAWSAYLGEGLRTQVAMLAVALAAVRVEAAREAAAHARPLDEPLLHAAIRSADLLLHHLSDTAVLVEASAPVEQGPAPGIPGCPRAGGGRMTRPAPSPSGSSARRPRRVRREPGGPAGARPRRHRRRPARARLALSRSMSSCPPSADDVERTVRASSAAHDASWWPEATARCTGPCAAWTGRRRRWVSSRWAPATTSRGGAAFPWRRRADAPDPGRPHAPSRPGPCQRARLLHRRPDRCRVRHRADGGQAHQRRVRARGA